MCWCQRQGYNTNGQCCTIKMSFQNAYLYDFWFLSVHNSGNSLGWEIENYHTRYLH